MGELEWASQRGRVGVGELEWASWSGRVGVSEPEQLGNFAVMLDSWQMSFVAAVDGTCRQINFID